MGYPLQMLRAHNQRFFNLFFLGSTYDTFGIRHCQKCVPEFSLRQSPPVDGSPVCASLAFPRSQAGLISAPHFLERFLQS